MDPRRLLPQLPYFAAAEGSARAARSILAGFSGGLDSTVLLHALTQVAAERGLRVRALHVHHGLQAQADAFAAHCERTCAQWSVPLSVHAVRVDTNGGQGPEAAARDARRAAFAQALAADEVLALAHHRDDQAETFLLRALRGSGAGGLASMRPWHAFASGWSWRPLLAHPRSALEDYARAHALTWIEDPSNACEDLDRNFLRYRLMPVLRERWPHAAAALAVSAQRCEADDALLADEDAALLAQVRTADPRVLSRPAVKALPATRRARVLRRWIRERGLPPLPAQGVHCIEHELMDARADAAARFQWQGACVQAWGELLHADHIRAPLPAGWHAPWTGSAPLPLPGGGHLRLEGAPAFRAPVRVHARAGGERIRLPGRAHTHALKHVLQDLEVPPWERARLPLLSDADGTLLAAGDLALSAAFDDWLRAHGARLRWLTD